MHIVSAIGVLNFFCYCYTVSVIRIALQKTLLNVLYEAVFIFCLPLY